MPVIEVHNLTKTFRTYKKQPGFSGAIKGLFHRQYEQTFAVNEVSFKIEPGELVGFLGPNGAGKTTTLKMLAGLLYPTSGAAKVLNYTPWERDDGYRRQFALVLGQKNQLWWDLPARESLELNAKIYGIPQERFEKTVGDLTELLAVKEKLNVSVRELSLGERMKMELIASLLHQPKVLFLDEPTIGLDVVAKERIREFLKEINRTEGTTVLLTTHDLSDIEELSQRIIIIDKGRILFDGDLGQMKKRLAKYNQVKFFLKDRSQVPRLAKIETDGIACERVDELTYLIRFDREQHSSAGVIREIVNNLEVRDLLVEEEPIEEIVKRIYLSGEVA